MHDFDAIVVGSGFGGSVSALRLTEKGHRVAVLEMGRRWRAEDFPETNWNLRRFMWMPRLGLRGFFGMSLFPHVFVLRGVGVGGGSLVYANTLLVPPPDAWAHPAWRDLADWQVELAPHYATAQRMLGVIECPLDTRADQMLREYAESIGTGDTFRRAQVGVFFGPPGETVPDPYFDGEGPARTGCTLCGGCMVGCRHGAKNTLDQNYLYFAEKGGAKVIPETRVTLIEALPGDDGARDGAGGYRVHAHDGRTWTAGRVVLSGGVLGTVELLMRSRQAGGLPAISDTLGTMVRTNSEALIGVRAGDGHDYSEGIAITSEVSLDAHTHVEPVRYPAGSDALALLTTLLVDGGGRAPRWLRWVGGISRHPLLAIRALWPFGWAKDVIILLVMQTLDNHLQLRMRRGPFGRRLVTERPPGQVAAPTYIPIANKAARAIAAKVQGQPGSLLPEVLLDIPTTAHILGGCPMGASAQDSVIDSLNRVHGYQGLMVVDGSMIGGNLGVNPSLTITAMAERAMAAVPPEP